jgi:hypothetical protein
MNRPAAENCQECPEHPEKCEIGAQGSKLPKALSECGETPILRLSSPAIHLSPAPSPRQGVGTAKESTVADAERRAWTVTWGLATRILKWRVQSLRNVACWTWWFCEGFDV